MRKKIGIFIFFIVVGYIGAIAQTDTINANLRVNGNILSDVGGGRILVLYDSSTVVRNRIILGADSYGAYIKSLWRTGGTDAFSIRDSKDEQVFSVLKNSNIGIGTLTTGPHKLAVEGTIGAREVKVEVDSWPDYVFDKTYELPRLIDVENYIQKNRHLKDIPIAEQVEKDGIYLGQMNAKLLQKIEELTLYTIAQEKQLLKLNAQIESQQKEIESQADELKSYEDHEIEQENDIEKLKYKMREMQEQIELLLQEK